MAVNICDNCGTAAADEQFCPNCGAWIDQLKPARPDGEDFEEFSLEDAPPEGEDVAAPVRFPRSEIPCPSCGSSNPASNRHCEECGARLSQGALPVAPRPAVQSTAGVRAALAIGGVLILVVLISLLFNLFGGDDPTTTSSVVAADTTTTTAPVAGPIAILRAECSVEGLSGFDCRNLIDSGDGEYQFNWERLESDEEVRIRLIFAEPMVVQKVLWENLGEGNRFFQNYRAKGLRISDGSATGIAFPIELEDRPGSQVKDYVSFSTLEVQIVVDTVYPAQEREGKLFTELAMKGIQVIGYPAPIETPTTSTTAGS